MFAWAGRPSQIALSSAAVVAAAACGLLGAPAVGFLAVLPLTL
jgi:hypothetical protein